MRTTLLSAGVRHLYHRLSAVIGAGFNAAGSSGAGCVLFARSNPDQRSCGHRLSRRTASRTGNLETAGAMDPDDGKRRGSSWWPTTRAYAATGAWHPPPMADRKARSAVTAWKVFR